jgi:type III pantothenate kinase
MILVVDIGNTNINFGIFKGKILKRSWSIPTKKVFLKSDLNLKSRLEKAIISSVYPKATQILNSRLKKILNIRPLIVGKDMKIPIKNLYKKPEQVGQDRLINAFAGREMYGAPLIIVDFGTAITLDVVSGKGDYLGGVIVPGIEISLEVLFKKCALLPQVKLSKPKSLIGKDTKDSILSGLLNGFGCLCDGLVIRLRKKLKKRPLVIATGGNVEFMRKFCKQIDKIDKNLTLKGLNLLTINRF